MVGNGSWRRLNEWGVFHGEKGTTLSSLFFCGVVEETNTLVVPIFCLPNSCNSEGGS